MTPIENLLTSEGETITEDGDKAELFNKFFASD